MVVSTSFRTAFIKQVQTQRNMGRYGSQVAVALNKEKGVVQVRDWNANLSYRTAKKLGLA